MHNVVNVELIEQRVSIFTNRSCKNNNLVKFSHSTHKLIDARSLDNVNVVVLRVNLHGDYKVGLTHVLEGAVDKRLVQIQHEQLAAFELSALGRQQRCVRTEGTHRQAFFIVHAGKGVVWWGHGSSVFVIVLVNLLADELLRLRKLVVIVIVFIVIVVEFIIVVRVLIDSVLGLFRLFDDGLRRRCCWLMLNVMFGGNLIRK